MRHQFQYTLLLIFSGLVYCSTLHARPAMRQKPHTTPAHRETAPPAAQTEWQSELPVLTADTTRPASSASATKKKAPDPKLRTISKHSPKDLKDAGDVVMISMCIILLAGCLTGAVMSFINPLLAMWIGIGSLGWLLLELIVFGAVATGKGEQIGAGLLWIFSAFIVIVGWFIQGLAFLGRLIFK